MQVEDISRIIACELQTAGDPQGTFDGGYTSDLLSDVMGNANAGDVLITIQGHKNTVAVANLVGMPAIILCNGRSAPEDMRAIAAQQGIAIYSTRLNQFTVSYRIAAALGLPDAR